MEWLTFVAMTVALYMVFLYVPNERTMGPVQKIFYFHVPTAWVAFLAFFVVLIGSLMYLSTRSRKWDIVALSSAEIGVVFTTLVLVTGPIWARAAWGAWWTWDPRLTTTLVLWFIYLAYLVIRASAEGSEKRARFAAVFGIIGFVDVPIVFMSIRWWRTIHPVVIEATRVGLTRSMLMTLLVSLLAFTLFFFYLMGRRMSLEMARDEVASLKDTLRAEM